MASGRMIQRKITKNRQLHELSSDTCRLAYTWMIPFIDKEGRAHGDPAIVRATVFPRRDDISLEQMEAFIQEWHDAGLVIIYEHEGDKFLYFPGFDGSQPGLRKDREPDSELPAPPAELIRQSAGCLPDDCRMIAGSLPDDCRQNDGLILIKENLNIREEKLINSPPPEKPGKLTTRQRQTRLFLDALGGLSFSSNDQANEMDYLFQTYGEEKVLEIAKWMGGKNPRSVTHAINAIRTAAPTWGEKKNGSKISDKEQQREALRKKYGE